MAPAPGSEALPCSGAARGARGCGREQPALPCVPRMKLPTCGSGFSLFPRKMYAAVGSGLKNALRSLTSTPLRETSELYQVLIRFRGFCRINDSLLCISEALHTHTAVFVHREVSTVSYRRPGDALWGSGERMAADSTVSSVFIGHVQEPRAIFNSFCCGTAPFKALGSALKPQLSHSVAAV